jgi:hypothetical protein
VTGSCDKNEKGKEGSRRWFVLCSACIPRLGAGTGVRRQGLALSIGPN